MLAYHAEHPIRDRLKQAVNNLCWASIRNRLRNWVRITTTMQEFGAGVISWRQDVWPRAEGAEIVRGIGVTPACHRMRSRR